MDASRAFFADLDGTIIFGAHGLAFDPAAPGAPPLVSVATNHLGAPASWMTTAAGAGVGRLLTAGRLIPVTARSLEQYRRVRLPGPSPRLALIANGGRLLRDDVLDAEHTAWIASRVRGSTPLAVVLAHLETVLSPEFCRSLHYIEDLACYVVVDVDATPADWVEALVAYTASVGWAVSDQGAKVYLLPAALDKGAAVQRLADELGIATIISAGDTLTDESMLRVATAACVPRQSALAPRAAAVGAFVTEASGVLAGEEIVAWAEALLSTSGT